MANTEAPAIQRDWEGVGSYLRQAIAEAAEEFGDNTAEQVLNLMGEGILPDSSAIIYLERLEPGIADWVIARSAEIQRETHDHELAEASSFRRKAKAFGKGLLLLQ